MNSSIAKFRFRSPAPMKKTDFPPGKDSFLTDTIARFTTILTGLDITPHPVKWYHPAANCWSVHIRSPKYPFLFTNGKGTSRPACMASALGEFWERLATNFFFSDYLLEDGNKLDYLHFPNEKWFMQEHDLSRPAKFSINHDETEQLLSEHLFDLYNPDDELTYRHLRDGNSDDRRGICALPFSNLTSGEKVYFPVGLLHNLYVSNGMAAGNSTDECSCQALAEIIERYTKNIIISKGISLPDLPDKTLAALPDSMVIIKKLQNIGLKVRIKDASLGGRYPVICALLTNMENGGVYAAFGASLRFEVAVERTLTELLQGRELNKFNKFSVPIHSLREAAEPYNLENHFINSDGLLPWHMFADKADFDFSPWQFTGSTTEEFRALKKIIAENGFDIYRAMYNYKDMYSCRILVPGMSEIYPISDLVWNNRIVGTDLRTKFTCLAGMSNNNLRRLLTEIEQAGLGDFQKISEITGVVFDDNGGWHSLTIGEIKARIHLALRNVEEAFEWCRWCVEFANLPWEKRRFFQALYNLLGLRITGLKPENFKNSLLALHTREEMERAEAVIAGEKPFSDITGGGDWGKISTRHNEILTLYRKFNGYKKEFNLL